jgi:hypothetical protein
MALNFQPDLPVTTHSTLPSVLLAPDETLFGQMFRDPIDAYYFVVGIIAAGFGLRFIVNSSIGWAKEQDRLAEPNGENEVDVDFQASLSSFLGNKSED